MNVNLFGKILILAGAIFIIMGLIFIFSGKIPFLGKLPGDFMIRRRDFTVYFPLTTSILISVILSAVFILINLFRK